MHVDWMMLANYAEAPPGSGLIYIAGGSWDTLSVGAPLVGAPEGVVAALQGSLAVRVLFHVTELGRDREVVVTIIDEDGGEVWQVSAPVRPEQNPVVPPGWDHGYNIVIQLAGVALPKFGLYTINLQIDGQHLEEKPFRVIKGY